MPPIVVPISIAVINSYPETGKSPNHMPKNSQSQVSETPAQTGHICTGSFLLRPQTILVRIKIDTIAIIILDEEN